MRAVAAVLIVWLVALTPAHAETVQVAVRGHGFLLAHLLPSGPGTLSVLFLPGDGGWRGFAITIGNRIAAAGYDVYALDTRDYLEASTGSRVSSVSEVADDLAAMALAIRRASAKPVAAVGWSEGAALVIATGARHPEAFAGLVAVGVPEQGTLGWRLRDSIASLAGREPDEPQFDVAPLLSHLGSVPLMMIQATRDPFTPMAQAQALFARAPGPKRLEFIEARNHRFDGGTDRFFQALLDGLWWMGPRPQSVQRRGRAQ